MFAGRRQAVLEAESPSCNHATAMTATLLRFEQLEPWQRDNPCIRTGYRPLSHSVRGALRSIGRWHNESINIVRSSTRWL